MFGFGYLEIGLVLLLLVMVIGAPATGRVIAKAFKVYREVDDTKRKVRDSFSLRRFFDRNS